MAETLPAAFRDLLDASFATLGTIGSDGRPHLSEVWFLHEEGEFKISLHAARQKTKNLQRNWRSTSSFSTGEPDALPEVRGDHTPRTTPTTCC
jgi:hypothetical protein